MVDNTIWLLITTVVAVVAGGVSGWASATLRRREAKAERIRQEVLLWTNPVLGAVKSLESRLGNILSDKLYLGLDPTQAREERPVQSDWSMDYEYVMESTLFLFAEYFAWIRLLQERLSFELFESQETRARFDAAMWDVSNEIGHLPLPAKFISKKPPEKPVGKQKDGHEDKDAQVFALQQRAIGEFLIDREAGTPRVRGYPEFLEARERDERFTRALAPLVTLLQGITPCTAKRWRRLEATLGALGKLKDECDQVLGGRQDALPSSTTSTTG
jgi:hypothetical protein